jgi:peptidoglycan biosynthesis protein MviN/MurJ (putative lipid II flippase)
MLVRLVFHGPLEQAAELTANVIACVCFVLLILAVVRDWRRRTPRGWMHWVGVVTALVSMVMGAAWIVVPQFLS